MFPCTISHSAHTLPSQTSAQKDALKIIKILRRRYHSPKYPGHFSDIVLRSFHNPTVNPALPHIFHEYARNPIRGYGLLPLLFSKNLSALLCSYSTAFLSCPQAPPSYGSAVYFKVKSPAAAARYPYRHDCLARYFAGTKFCIRVAIVYENAPRRRHQYTQNYWISPHGIPGHFHRL